MKIINPMNVIMAVRYQPPDGHEAGRITSWRMPVPFRIDHEKMLSAFMACIAENVAIRRDSLEDKLELAYGIASMIQASIGGMDNAISRARAVSDPDDWKHPGSVIIRKDRGRYSVTASEGISAGVFAMLIGVSSFMLLSEKERELFRSRMASRHMLRRDVELYHYAHMDSQCPSATMHEADSKETGTQARQDGYRSVSLLRNIRFEDYAGKDGRKGND